MNDLAILNTKLPKNFYRTYSEIQNLSDDELPDINNVNSIIDKINSVETISERQAGQLLIDLVGCYPSKSDKRLVSDFFTNAVLGLFMKYTPQVCAAAMNEIVLNNKFLPVIAEFKTILDKHNAERLRPLQVANMYQRRIAKAKPKQEKATPEQIQQIKDKLG